MNIFTATLILACAIAIVLPATAAPQTINPVMQSEQTQLLRYLLYLNPAIGLQVTPLSKDCLAFDSTSTLRSWNRVLHSGTPTATEIAAAKAFFNNRPFTWLINVSDIASQKIVEDNNLHYKISCTAMRAHLDTMPHQQHSDDILVTSIDLNDALLVDTWATLVTTSFPLDKAQLVQAFSTLKNQIISPHLRIYLGFYKEKVVTTAMVIQHGDTISFHLIGTLPEFRKKGLASAVIHTALSDATKAGCKQAVLLSITDSSLFKKIGFKAFAAYKIYGN
jgi:GNAT superfamily N-acetyltransferase